jgi:uncharacterized protein (TIGR02246 family)
MKHYIALCAAAMALMLTACNQAMPDTREADIKAIKDGEEQWNKDYAAKDVEKVMSHFADNAVLMTPYGPSNTGKDAIRKALTPLVGDPAFSLKFSPARVEVAKSGDIGYTQGSYQLTVTDPGVKQPIQDHGSYVTTYAKQADGSWKAVADIATSEVPPPAK